jgi:hypothetical protein
MLISRAHVVGIEEYHQGDNYIELYYCAVEILRTPYGGSLWETVQYKNRLDV